MLIDTLEIVITDRSILHLHLHLHLNASMLNSIITGNHAQKFGWTGEIFTLSKTGWSDLRW